MNIAFTTILFFILLAPGYIARTAYSSSNLSVRDYNKNLVNELTWSIIPSLALHALFTICLTCFTRYAIDFVQLGNLMLGVTGDNKVELSFRQLGYFKYEIFLYNLILFGASFLAGYLSRRLIRTLHLDRKMQYFRFSNKWHYIFTGECLDFSDVVGKHDQITDKIINVLCSVNGRNILYTGEYLNYYVDAKGDLEAIHLRNPIRRYLESDVSSENRYFIISSRYLVIPNASIININFRYFSLEEVDEVTISESELSEIIEDSYD